MPLAQLRRVFTGLSFGTALVFAGCGQSDDASNLSAAWEPTQEWSETYENQFSAWVQQLGEARAAGVCNRLLSCLRNPRANSLYQPSDDNIDLYVDCAKLPYVMRAYFAYRKQLPFYYTKDIDGEGRDLRYNSGNWPTAYASHLSYSSPRSLLSNVVAEVYSATFRMKPALEGTDTYPIDIQRRYLRPGTVYYDPNGHVLMVYKVLPNGDIKMIDSHPDNSLTFQTFGERFARGAANTGGGFRNWRPFHREGNRFVWATNQNAPGLSAAQYQSEFIVDGRRLNYYQWVRARMSESGSRIRPVEELTAKVNELCVDISFRIESVDAAISAGIHRRAHPDELPFNIFGTSGDWESYSTPSRDARLKTAVKAIHNYIEETIALVDSNDPSIDYDGSSTQLRADYRRIWTSAVGSCRISYTNSRGAPVRLTFNDFMDRLFKLSFDPYHCPELRWGAVQPRDGEQYCPDNADKRTWFENEQRLRNVLTPVYNVRTDVDYGPGNSPQIDFRELF